MKPNFQDFTSEADRFFQILPADWQEDIVPDWPHYRHSSRVFTLESDQGTLGGGIVFSTVSPDTKAYKEEAQKLFDSGYLYIGFIWIAEQHRGKQLGSFWLQELFNKMPHQKFWLSIDEYELASFYTRFGFKLLKSVQCKGKPEWILVKE